MDLYATLQDEGFRLSASEGRIADVLLGDFQFAASASITALAHRARVSPPTVTRFCRRLGCDSYADFKLQVARTTYVGARYLRPEADSRAPTDVAKDVVEQAQNALFLFHRNLDLPAVVKAVDLLAGAEMIYAFGAGGNSSMIAGEIQNRLFRLGLRITATADHGMQLMMAAAAKPADVLIGSSLSGRNGELARSFALAREHGVATIALTQSESLVAKAATVAIPIDLAESANIYRPTATRMAYLAAVDILANLVAHRLQPQAAISLRRIKQGLVALRDGDDRQPLGD